MSFANRLKGLRLAGNYTQKQVYEAVHMSPLGYQRYEYGEREPAFAKLIALSDFFNVPLDFLCGRGVFSNWDSFSAHLDDLRGVVGDALGLPASTLALLDFSQLLSFIEAFFSRIEYDPVQNSFTLSPRLPMEVSQRILHGNGNGKNYRIHPSMLQVVTD